MIALPNLLQSCNCGSEIRSRYAEEFASQTLIHGSVINEGRSADLTLERHLCYTKGNKQGEKKKNFTIHCSELRDAIADVSGSYASSRIRVDVVFF